MSELNPGGEEYKPFTFETVSESYFADGTGEAVDKVTGLNPEEAREATAEIRGMNVDDVTVIGEMTPDGVVKPYGNSKGKSRAFFAANRWNSSWDPKADPNLN